MDIIPYLPQDLQDIVDEYARDRTLKDLLVVEIEYCVPMFDNEYEINIVPWAIFASSIWKEARLSTPALNARRG
jgi:hypothetical protein